MNGIEGCADGSMVMIEKRRDGGVGSDNCETASQMLEFEQRDPNHKVFNALKCLDKATPRLQINLVSQCSLWR